MRQYWWVNHKKTAKHEVGDGFLWSPNAIPDRWCWGHEHMPRALAGDCVLSFVENHIRHVGLVTESAFPASKPPEFEKIAPKWGKSGWRVPVTWTRLAEPVQPRAFKDELRPLLPLKYSPMNRIGNGEQGVYFQEIDETAFARVLRDATYDAALIGLDDIENPLNDGARDVADERVARAIREDLTLSETEKQRLQSARTGQGVFRQNLFAREAACRVTGVKNPWLLKASHIKPWRFCDSGFERLDPNNGLLLTPMLDHLFDLGFITFEVDGQVLVSRQLDDSLLERLDLKGLRGRRTAPFAPAQAAYLAWHRDNMFKT